MEKVGWITVGVLAVVVVVGAVVGLRSIPDVRRYLKMRSM